jgi:hypothetical protein
MEHIKMTVTRKRNILILGVLILGLGCTNKTGDKHQSVHLAEIIFEDPTMTSSNQTMFIDKPVIVEFIVNDLDYNKYERENAKQEYYKLTDFQGYYSEIVIPIIDSLKVNRITLQEKDNRLNFKNEQGDSYIVDINKIKFKQGLILFNGQKPIFWNGQTSGELDEFIKEYFE